MDPQTQDRLQDQLEALIDDAADRGVPAAELLKWLASEAEYQIQNRVENGDLS